MNLDVSVRKKQGDFQCHAEFSLTGRRVGLFGSSGSGKSTLMHLLAGLLTPDAGHIRLDGRVLFESATGINLPPEKRRVGVVFQHSLLFPHMSVRRNLLYGWRRTDEKYRHIAPEAISEVLHLAPLLDRGVNMLSGGERQRVALARTVLTCPSLILMDEPLTGLDEDLKLQVIPYLNKVLARFDIPSLFISHSLVEMRLMTEQVLLVEQGRIMQEMTTEELALSDRVAAQQGYNNLLRLGKARPHGDLWAYQWGDCRLVLTTQGDNDENIFALDSREILLCKHHPGGTSVRNLLPCTVRNILAIGHRVQVELQCGTNKLFAQVVPESIRELEISAGSEVMAMIKASAFRPLL